MDNFDIYEVHQCNHPFTFAFQVVCDLLVGTATTYKGGGSSTWGGGPVSGYLHTDHKPNTQFCRFVKQVYEPWLSDIKRGAVPNVEHLRVADTNEVDTHRMGQSIARLAGYLKSGVPIHRSLLAIGIPNDANATVVGSMSFRPFEGCAVPASLVLSNLWKLQPFENSSAFHLAAVCLQVLRIEHFFGVFNSIKNLHDQLVYIHDTRDLEFHMNNLLTTFRHGDRVLPCTTE